MPHLHRIHKGIAGGSRVQVQNKQQVKVITVYTELDKDQDSKILKELAIFFAAKIRESKT